jgi:ATP-dependent protease ClpP protease subunit
MSIAKETTDLNAIHDLDIDVKARTVYLMGREDHPPEYGEEPGVEYRMASRFIRNMHYLSNLDDHLPILVVMKTCGGDWGEGMAIYDCIFSIPNPVTIVAYLHARSMSSIIFQAANKRIMMPNSDYMLHLGTYGDEGTYKQVETNWEWGKRDVVTMLDIYEDVMKTHPEGKCRNWSRKRIREWLVAEMNKKEDVFFSPEDAVKWGLADEVFTTWDTVFDYTAEQKIRK